MEALKDASENLHPVLGEGQGQKTTGEGEDGWVGRVGCENAEKEGVRMRKKMVF